MSNMLLKLPRCLFALQFKPYIQKGNEGFVHHLVIYECHNRGQFNDSFHYGPGFDCHDYANMPFLECYVYSLVAVWAVGAEVKCLAAWVELVPVQSFSFVIITFYLKNQRETNSVNFKAARNETSFSLYSFNFLILYLFFTFWRHFITHQTLVITLEQKILQTATCSRYTMTTRKELKVSKFVYLFFQNSKHILWLLLAACLRLSCYFVLLAMILSVLAMADTIWIQREKP